MSAQQAHLFDPPEPLLERFGRDFFRAVPPRPGVYIMGGEAGRVLYIGQSQNLRARLGSYKNARPDRAPRKIIRLVHAVRSIVWEECHTPEAARLKENELLRTHRPRFNVQNTWPRAYRFIVLHTADAHFTLQLSFDPDSSGRVFGAFKGAAGAFAALLRLLWAALHQPASPVDFPMRMFDARPPAQFQFGSPNLPAARWIEPLNSFLAGASDGLLTLLAAALPAPDSICAFQRNLQALDLEVLAAFFAGGPGWNRRVRERHELPGPILPQDQLDDWLVREERPRLHTVISP
jgi:hypothetical protein